MKILVPTDFSETSFSAYQYACHFAKKCNGKITLIHVLNGMFNMSEFLSYEPIEKHRTSALIKLEYFAHEYAKTMGIELPEVPISIDMSYGIPGFEITDFAHEGDYDIIITGTRDRYGIFDSALGSASEITIRQAPCPVLLIHKGVRYEEPSKIVFAFDRTTDLEDSVESLISINKTFNAKVDFVHVSKDAGDQKLLEQKEEIMEELFDEGEPNFAVEIKVIPGKDLHNSLKDYCLFERADMLTMVHRKEGIFTNLFRRQNSIKMAQEFHLPVLIFNENN